MGRTLSYEELIFVNCIIENSTTNMKITWCRLAVWPNKKVGSRTKALSWSHILLARYCPAKQPKVHTKLYLKISWSWHLLLAGLQSCPRHQWQRFENQTTSTENHGLLLQQDYLCFTDLFLVIAYRVSHSKVYKVNWLWWMLAFEFFLV